MNRPAVAAGVAGALLLVLCGFIGLPLVANPAYACGNDVAIAEPSVSAGIGQWSQDQVQNAATIVAAGKGMDVPPRGWVVALATAMQESTLRNLANDNPGYPLVTQHSLALPHQGVGHDHDSVGLFQQRPNPPEGVGVWGTVAELMAPATAAHKFYAALQKVDGWQAMSVNDAAQAVQGSGTPGAYAKWETAASALAAQLAGLPDITSIGGGPPGGECGPDTGPVSVSTDGWTAPAAGKIVSPFGPRDGRLHAGTDIGAARNAPIHAAAGGAVIVSMCGTPNPPGCDVDGSTDISGCGWYVEIAHEGGITTRYCHQVHEPYVHVGDQVTAGQTIGQVGSSGNSSGPHLHFEIHVGVTAGHTGSNSDAVDPVPFLADRGVKIG